MPIYEFRCPGCGYEKEVLVPYDSEKIRPTCPQCWNHEMQRLPSAPAIQFRGTGWTAKGPGRRE